MFPEIRITSTTAIEPATNTIYVEAKTRETAGTVNGQTCSTTSPCYVHRLHAMDLLTEAVNLGGPVVISSPSITLRIHIKLPSLLFVSVTSHPALDSQLSAHLHQWVHLLHV